ncbi:MAG: 30S ribosomal protein S3 [Akkermansiaceae bacterium]
MGQKVNPIGFRLAVNKDWRSKWYAEGKDYTNKLHEDLKIREYMAKRLQGIALSKVVIERAWNSVRVTLHTSRPGLVIGRKGSEIENITREIGKICGGSQVKIDIVEIRKPELDAQHVCENIAVQLERRIAFRRAMKRAIQTAMDFGANGIRVRCGGRLGGADIARAEWYREGKVPLQTLRVPIDYGFAEAKTVYGIIGVKCWINKDADADKGGRPGGDRERRPRRGPGGPGGDRRGGGGGRGGDRRDNRDNNNSDKPAEKKDAAPAS